MLTIKRNHIVVAQAAEKQQAIKSFAASLLKKGDGLIKNQGEAIA